MINLRIIPTVLLRSLQLRLLITTSLASSVILALLGLSIYLFMWHRLLDEFDTALLTKARNIAAMVESNGSTISFDADLQQMPEFTTDRRPEYFEIWLHDGKVLARSPSLHGKDLPRPAIDPIPSSLPVLLPDGHRGRQIAIAFVVRPEQDDEHPVKPTSESAIVVLAARPIIVNQTLDDLSWLLTTLCAAAVVVCGIALVLIVRREVQPIHRIAAEIGSLKETDLSRRLDSRQVPTELSPVIEKLNGLLGRLDQSFSREKAFTADVAHELRTPLAGIQTTLEVCRTRPRESSEYENVIDECRSMTDRLQALIENLLLLARADAGQLPIHRQKTDLYHLMQECWLPMLGRVEQKHLQVDNTNIGDCTVQVDADKMRIILRNLLDNAVSYVPDGGAIRWSVARSEKEITIQVTNTGSQIPEQEAAKLFDRFYRADTSRTDTGVHCGLGLSLCQRLIRMMDGTLTIETQTGGDFTARLDLPILS